MRSIPFALIVLLASATGLIGADEKKKSDPKTKVAPKPAAKTPAKPAGDADPLKGLGTTVELPPLTPVGKWSTLAKVAMPDNLIVLFSLRGGDRCLGPGKKVELKELAGGRSWQCLAIEKEGTEPVEIGVFRIEKQQLQFAWSEGAEKISNAVGLQNGAFEIAAAASKRVVGLRKPLKGSPLAISFDEPSTVFLEIPNPPRLDSVKIEIDMPSPEYKSRNVNWRLLGDGPALKANGGELWAESIRLGHLAVKLESTFNKSLKITATPMFWIADREKPQRLTTKNLIAAIAQVNAYQTQLTATRDQLSKNKNASDAQKAQRDAMTKELAIVRKAASDLETLQDFVETTKLGNLQLKVSHEIEPGFAVPLLTTK